MAKGTKTGGKAFVKGQSGNPNGRPKMSPETKRLKKLTKSHFNDVAQQYLLSTVDDLRKKFADTSTPALDMILIKVLIEAVNKGDVGKLEFILERTIGKVTERMDIKHSGQGFSNLEGLTVAELTQLRSMAEKCQG